MSLLVFSDSQVLGQEKVNLSIGAGIPEWLNIGIRYQLEQTQIGMSIGTLPLNSNQSIFSISSDLFYHFGGHSKLSARRPWHGRVGLNYFRNETEFLIKKSTSIYARLGRDFNISKKIGVAADAGLGFKLLHNEIEKKPQDCWVNFEYNVIPSISISVFYRL